MNNPLRFAAVLTAAGLAAGMLPLAAAQDSLCNEVIERMKILIPNLNNVNLQDLQDLVDEAKGACNGWATAGPAVTMATATGFQATSTATSPVSTLCGPGGAAFDRVPVTVTFKFGGQSVGVPDVGPGSVQKDENGVTHYSVQGKIFGLTADSGANWGSITVVDTAVEIFSGPATVLPYCKSPGEGTCGGQAAVESNTDRVSASGLSAFIGCQA